MRRAFLLLDLVAVLLFVSIGRGVHSHGLTVAGIASTAWPFLTGLAAGWIILAAERRDPVSLFGGLVALVSTVALGMVLRVVSGQGTALAFIIVTMVFLGAVMVGWRLVLVRIERRRHGGRTS